MEIDSADIRLLKIMQDDARIGLDALAEKISLSRASIQRRLKRLRDNNIIVKDISILDPSKVGHPMTFVVMVELERERIDQIDAFSKLIKKEPQVQQCYYITGEADFCLICICRDMNDFEALTHRLFFDNSNVRRFRTSVVMGRKKIGLEVPL